MIIDVHCHIGLSARKTDPSIERFHFERAGAAGTPGYDSYLAPRMLKRVAWFFVKRWMGIDPRLPRGDEMDKQIEAANLRHWDSATGVDRFALLAFDEYHDDDGRPIGAAESGQKRGTDLYASNSFVRAFCRTRPDRYLFAASIHPYRTDGERDACDMLSEVVEGGAVLVKWLPIHQNIRAEDPRTVAFLRRAAELGVPMLIHYGGEMSLSRQHMEFESPSSILEVLRQLRREDAMPATIIAHTATPSFRWQSRAGFDELTDALIGEFADAPLYADNSALAAFGRTKWLSRLADMPEVHRKLVWGSDFPIPVLVRAFRKLDRATRRRIKALPSWVEQDLQLKRALGFQDCVFEQAEQILKLS